MYRKLLKLKAVTAFILAIAGPAAWAATAASSSSPAASSDASDIMARGKYLSIAADCIACHTAPKGKPYAGGYAIASPMGTIWSSNITPSAKDGIGSYTEAQFAQALRVGVRPDGSHLYPAMPYVSYAQMTDADVAALYQYFMKGVAPVDTPAPETKLPFPFNIRAAMAVWNLMYAPSHTGFTPEAGKSAQYVRGQYLVTALEHCAECHTPRNFMMALDTSRSLSGGQVGSWYAPNITADPVSGIGGWSDQDLYAYLKTGHVMGLAQAAGPMAEAVQNSLQYLNDADLRAMVTYLKQGAPVRDINDAQARNTFGEAAPKPEAALTGAQNVGMTNPGWTIYSNTCAACHGAQGQGSADYPSLFHNTATGAQNPNNLIATILFGVHRTVNGKAVDMPAFGPDASFTERLSDQDVADVSNYVLNTFGNPSQVVSAADVQTLREGGPPSALVQAAQMGIPLAILVVLILIAVIVVVVIRRRSRKG